jgi:creatinine amidohydrolase/Fe(II)-dependent formamide hydrolase-like protein
MPTGCNEVKFDGFRALAHVNGHHGQFIASKIHANGAIKEIPR